jgi:ribosomal protein S21
MPGVRNGKRLRKPFPTKKGRCEVEIEVFEDNIEQAIKKFKKRISESGILGEVRRRSFALTKGQKRRAKDLVAARRRVRAKARERSRLHP